MPPRDIAARREGLERAAALYLEVRCYQKSSAARVSDFAQYLALTAPYLSRVAAAILGMSLRDFLRQRQLERAIALLRDGVGLEEVALRAGFGTIGTLYRWFRLHYDTTPASFREGQGQERRGAAS